MLSFLDPVFSRYGQDEAIVWNERSFSYGWLASRIREQKDFVKAHVEPGTVVALCADFSPESVALLLALVEMRCIIVPLVPAGRVQHEACVKIAEAECLMTVNDHDEIVVRSRNCRAGHSLYQELQQRNHPGLILFSSGSTGKSKAVVHDFAMLLEKFHQPRQRLRTLSFLLYDHIGGINTLLYALANGGCVITVRGRRPDDVLPVVERHRAELLPTTPTFLRLMLISEAHLRYDLSSLRTITYGTEPMPEETLKRLHAVLPDVRLQQTYGLSEVGILRSKSRDSSSLWVKVGGEGFETRVVDGILHIKARSGMLGYLNAPSPFTEDGWLNTGDSVEVDGEYLRIRGRKSEVINVGGEKVYPAEVEGVIQQLDNVAEATVYGEANPLVGQMVCVRVSLCKPEDPSAFKARLKEHCRQYLERFKVPARVTLCGGRQHNERFKKIRAGVTPAAEDDSDISNIGVSHA